MSHFMSTMTGLVFFGMAGPAMANPAMLPKHPGYPSSGEFANDTGRKNLTYGQSIEEAAKSGDTTMGTALLMLKFQDTGASSYRPFRKGRLNSR